MRHTKFFIPLIIFIIISFSFYRVFRINPTEIPSPLIGKSAPPFSAASVLNPQHHITQSIFLKKITLLNIFASWCPSCAAEQSVLMNFHHDFPAVQIIGLAFKDKMPDTRQFLKKMGNPYSTVINDEKGSIGIDFGVYGTPETFVINPQGKICDKIVGPISPDMVQDKLIPLIKKCS